MRYRVEKRPNDTRRAWRVLGEDGTEVTEMRVYDFEDGSVWRFPFPVCFDTESAAVQWVREHDGDLLLTTKKKGQVNAKDNH